MSQLMQVKGLPESVTNAQKITK